ncbi:MAG: PAS domain S-box protein, partial [Spirochaetota bacterium]|nr:PAS domain S-box protein [Spirochaetota bacterium]
MSFTDNIKKNLINRNDFTILFVPVFFIIIIFLLFWHTIDSFHHQKKEYIIADLVHNQESLIQFIIKQSFVDKNSSIHSQEMARKKLLEVSRLLAHGGIGYSPFEPNKTQYLKTVKDKRLKKGFQLLEKKIQSWLSMVKETDLLSQTDPKFLELKEKVLSEGEDLTIDIKRINHHLMDHVKEEMSESVNLYIKIIVLGFIIGLLSAYKVIKIKRDLQDEIKQHKITNSRVSKYEHELEKMVEDRTNRLMNALSKIREEDLIRREIEKEMKTSEKRYRQLIEFSPLGILVIYNEKIMYSNALGAEILAVSTTDRIIGQKISDVILPYFKNNLEAIIERVTKHKEEVFWNEEKYVRPDGSNIYMDIMASLVVDDDIEGIQLILRNVTQRKALNDEVYRLATAAEQAAESIVITNIDAEILYVNPAFERSTGYKKEEVIGQSPRLLKSGKHDALYYKTLWDTITVGKVWTGELINKRKNGSLYYEQTS